VKERKVRRDRVTRVDVGSVVQQLRDQSQDLTGEVESGIATLPRKQVMRREGKREKRHREHRGADVWVSSSGQELRGEGRIDFVRTAEEEGCVSILPEMRMMRRGQMRDIVLLIDVHSIVQQQTD
jgi:hypothetical protein